MPQSKTLAEEADTAAQDAVSALATAIAAAAKLRARTIEKAIFLRSAPHASATELMYMFPDCAGNNQHDADWRLKRLAGALEALSYAAQ